MKKIHKIFLLSFFYLFSNIAFSEINYSFKSHNYFFENQKIFESPASLVVLHKFLLNNFEYNFRVINEKEIEISFANQNIPNIALKYIGKVGNTYNYNAKIFSSRIGIINFDSDIFIDINNYESSIIIDYPDLPFINDVIKKKVAILFDRFVNYDDQVKLVNSLVENNVNDFSFNSNSINLVNIANKYVNNNDISKDYVLKNPKKSYLITFFIFIYIVTMLSIFTIFIFMNKKLSN